VPQVASSEPLSLNEPSSSPAPVIPRSPLQARRSRSWRKRWGWGLFPACGSAPGLQNELRRRPPGSAPSPTFASPARGQRAMRYGAARILDYTLVPGPRHTTLTLRPPSSEQHGFRVRDFAARPERVRNRTRTRLHATDRGVRDRSVAHGKDHAGEQLVSPLLSDPHMRAAQAEVASEPCLRLSASGLHCAGRGSKEHFEVCVFRTVSAHCTRSILIIRPNSA